MKSITSLKIEKLFGTFDYEIDFEKMDGFTILTAPNGFGKSTILKIIRAAAVGNICFFACLIFDRIEMVFRGTVGDEWQPRTASGTTVEPLAAEDAQKPKETRLCIVKERRAVEHAEATPEPSETEAEMEEHYTCTITCDDFTASFTDEEMDRTVNEAGVTIPTLEPLYPYASNNGTSRLWKDKRDGEVFDISGIFRRYSYHFRKFFPWILSMVHRLNFEVNYISTNRLYNEEGEHPAMNPYMRRPMDEPVDRGQNTHLLKILSISKDIHAAYMRSMRQQLQIARSLESNFVDRVVEQLNKKKEERPTAEETRKKITTKINAIRRIETSCNEFGITSKNNKMNKNLETDDDSALIVFSTYLDDVKAKLDVFEPLIKRLKIFAESLKSLLDLKTASINLSDWEDTLVIKSAKSGLVIPRDALSSGEQHLIVLLGRLLFDASNAEALVMMDEPEISFHPSWQEKFAEILFKIQNEDAKGAKGQKRQFIVATHSPSFIGDHWDKTVELAKMVR